MPVVAWTRKAYILGKALHPIDMYEKLDQDFEEYATPWELIWSDLSAPYNRGFTPIIDGSWTVVGHLGTIQGGMRSQGETSLIVPSELARRVDLKRRWRKVFLFLSAARPAFRPAGRTRIS